jgi:Flp pilus assembly protein TadD
MDIIYYSSYRQQNMKLRIISIIFCAVLFLVAYQSPCFSVDFKDQAEKYREKGLTAQKRGDIQGSISFYKKAVSLNPNYVAAYNDLGIAYEYLGQFNLAEENYLKAIELDKYYVAAYSNLASLYQNMGRLEEAALFWKRRVEFGKPDDYWTKKAKENLHKLLSASKDFEASVVEEEINNFNKEVAGRKMELTRQNIAQAKERFEHGKKFLKEKLYSEAKKEFQQALKFTPNDPEILNYYKKARQQETEQKVKTHAQRGVSYYEVGDTDQAREEFERLLSVIPDKSNQ